MLETVAPSSRRVPPDTVRALMVEPGVLLTVQVDDNIRLLDANVTATLAAYYAPYAPFVR